MFSTHWYREIRGAAAFWIAGFVFTLVGGVFTAVGALTETFFLLIGIPFSCLGLLIIALLIYSLYLKLAHPEKYHTWLWWVNFSGGLLGALLFAVPSTLALPILLLVDAPSETIWIGVLFSAIGVVVSIAVGLIGMRQYRKRPR